MKPWKLLTLVLGAALWREWREARREVRELDITRLDRVCPQLKRRVRVAVLSDLHLSDRPGGAPEERLQRWISATRREQPDLILLCGDLIDRDSVGSEQALTRQLARLNAPLGTWAVVGNHDRDALKARGHDLDDWQHLLSHAGVGLLVNSGRALRDDLYLGGTDEPQGGWPDPGAAMREAASGQLRLLMTHHPNTARAAWELPRDLQPHLSFAGHTHGGQLRSPWGPLVVPGWADQGWRAYDAGGHWNALYITRGLGTTRWALRRRCRPELVIIDLEPDDRRGLT